MATQAAAAQILPSSAPGASALAPAPIVKWVGGKGRLLGQLRPMLPPGVERMRHVEPFVGGAAMFFARQPERALLCDVNGALIGTYRAVRDDVESVIDALGRLAERHDKEHYYATRVRYNESRHGEHDAARAAQFIYLNKTCFNGLHRVNRSGEFNVPAGRYKNPRILNADALRSASALLARATLDNEPFEALLGSARPGDFVYFDPPYEPVNQTSNFTGYASGGFRQEDQTRLRDVFDELTRRGAKCMLSNSDVPFIRELYRKHRIDTVVAPRAVNCNAKRRGLVNEVVVRNY